MELKSVADMVGDLVHPNEIATNSTRLATPKPAPTLAISPNSTISIGEPLASVGVAEFWQGFIDRVNECDRLIHELCDLRNDTPEHRADLLAVRKRMAPARIDDDIKHLCEAIEQATPKAPTEPERDCRDCMHHRGRDNNRVRYCINADSAAQHGGSLASAIPDCSIASRCSEFKRATG